MAIDEAKKVNKKNVKLQNNMNRGWKIGPITVIVVLALIILFIIFFSYGLWK